MPPARTSPTPKDSRAARAARRDRVVLAEIELWRSVAGQQAATPSRRSSSGSTTDGSVVDENGSIAGTEEDPEDETSSVASTRRRRRPLRPRQPSANPTRTLRPLPSRTPSLMESPTASPPAATLEARSLESEISHPEIVQAVHRPSTPSTPRRRSTRLRL
ncbi:hypothetical protein RSOLAG22IIIB_06404 [Rhizoctonia solani]|uniref:Uncharacterized protein n=1 Tax=Rhizoctonia solani TaxID=456999 RepID=A0A0K6GEP8_9AGAM|nr:unnamed protein product [Rhizoctonia solani]CUA76940.1 hypothetical protein RSOLAG22IIIB_06404 [Rhizoctonia solani]